MTYSEFVLEMQKKLQDYLGENVDVEKTAVQKNNGVILQGLSMKKKGEHVAPTIYMDKFYQYYNEGISMDIIREQIVEIYRDRSTENIPDFNFFSNYDEVKNCLSFKVINYKKNQELLKDVPHVIFLNLAIVFYCQICSREMGNATVLIHNSHMENWDISKRQLYRDAMENAPKILPGSIQTMEEVIKETFRQELRVGFREMHEEKKNYGAADSVIYEGLEGAEQSEDIQMEKNIRRLAEEMYEQEMHGEKVIPMLVLTNSQKHFGAACMLYEGLLDGFAKEINRNIFILPSSVHEVILLPESGQDRPGDLQTMVKEVNASQVEEEERLSDSVYYYDRENQAIRIYEEP